MDENPHAYNSQVALTLFNKPYHVLSQFSDESGRKSLADFIPDRLVYPAGRLDYDSEGLIALTDDGKLQSRISEPRVRLPKYYWAQVEGEADEQRLRELRQGVKLKEGTASALLARCIESPAGLWPRNPPIRVRKSVADCWLEIVIDQGRNRQVRRMTAAIGLPTLRLIRHRIGPWSLADLKPGESRSVALERAWNEIRNYDLPEFD